MDQEYYKQLHEDGNKLAQEVIKQLMTHYIKDKKLSGELVLEATLLVIGRSLETLLLNFVDADLRLDAVEKIFTVMRHNVEVNLDSGPGSDNED